MINASIAKLLYGKTEEEAIKLLKQFNRTWRVVIRDEEPVPNLSPDRDDNRYSLVINAKRVERVTFG